MMSKARTTHLGTLTSDRSIDLDQSIDARVILVMSVWLILFYTTTTNSYNDSELFVLFLGFFFA
jgi:hypothetical protein